MPQKCLYMSEETAAKLEKLAAKKNLSQAKYIEFLINNAYEKEDADNEKLLSVLQSIARDTNKKITLLNDVFNSYLYSFSTVEGESDFHPTDEDMHIWFSLSKKYLNQKITNLQISKAAKNADGSE